MSVATNGAPAGQQTSSGTSPSSGNDYNDGFKLEGGQQLSRTITPGGHQANDDLLAIGAGHRKLANPLPLGAWSFATTTFVLSMYNVGVRGITVPNAIVAYASFYGGFVQFLAGLWEFATGNTLGASIFIVYGMFWWGFSMILIPFFGAEGTYDGVPGVYAPEGAAPTEADSAIGLFLWIYFGITAIFTIASLRSSITLFVLLFLLDLTFAMLGAYYYTGNVQFERAGGGLGIAVAFIAYYLGLASLLTDDTSYFRLPLGSLAPKE